MNTNYTGPFFPSLFLLLTLTPLTAQDPPDTPAEYRKNYERRIRQEYLNGVYIPKDLTDAFVALNELIDEASRAKFKAVSEETAATKLHFSFGRWMIRNWGFYEGSRLSHFIRENLGIYHPDDMARFIIITYHRSLNRQPLEVKELLKVFHEKQEREKQRLLEEGKIINEWKRQRNGGENDPKNR